MSVGLRLRAGGGDSLDRVSHRFCETLSFLARPEHVLDQIWLSAHDSSGIPKLYWFITRVSLFITVLTFLSYSHDDFRKGSEL
jgi:hypothetical protein